MKTHSLVLLLAIGLLAGTASAQVAPEPIMRVSFDGDLRARGTGLAAWRGQFSRPSAAYTLNFERVKQDHPRFERGRFGLGVWMESGHYGSQSRGHLNSLAPEQANPEGPNSGFRKIGKALFAESAGARVGKGCIAVTAQPGAGVATRAVAAKYLADGLKQTTFIGSAYVRSPQQASVRLFLRDAKTGATSTTVERRTGGTWQRVSAVFSVPQDGEAELELCLVNTGVMDATWCVDALALEHSGRYTEAKHPSSWAPGQTRRAAERLDYPIRGLFNAEAGTVSLWVKPVQPSGRHTFFCVGEYWDQAWMIGDVDRRLEFTARSTPLRTRGTLRVGEWNHVAMAWDAETVRAFLDGKPIGETRLKEVDLPPTHDYFLRIGNATGLVTGPGGVIDELLVFGRALTADQVATLARSEAAQAAEPVAVTWESARAAFSRDERRVEIPLFVHCRDGLSAGQVELRGFVRDRETGRAVPNDGPMTALPIDVGTLACGEHSLRVEVRVDGKQIGAAEFPLVVGPWMWRDAMPFLAWSTAEQSAKLQPYVDAGITALFNSSPRGLDNCVAAGVDGGMRLFTTKWRREGRDEDRIEHADGSKGGVWWHAPQYQAYCREQAETIRDRARANPHFRYILINTEHHSELNLSTAGRSFARRELGFDIPPFSVNGLTHPPYLSVAWSKRIEEAYPADAIIPSGNQWLTFYRWFYERGSGVNVANDMMARIINEAGEDVVTVYDPALRWPPCFNYESMRLQEEWVYVPDPKDMLFVLERSKCNARGRADFAGMPQLLFKKGVAAPFEAAVPPDMIREALWLCLSRPVDQVTVWGWHLILDNEEHNNPETLRELGQFSREVLRPYGPMLRALRDRPREVGYLDSLASDLFRTQRWHWEPSARYKPLAAAGVLADVLYDESITEDGALDRYTALILPGVTALTQDVHTHITEFVRRGGLVIADELLGPKIESVCVVPELAPDHVADLLRDREMSVPSPHPDTVHNWRTDGVADYLVIVNDKRVPGPLFGEYGKVRETGVAQTASWQALPDIGQYVYSLRQSRRLPVEIKGDMTSGTIDLPPCAGDILAFYPSPVGELSVVATVISPSERTVTVELRGIDGKRFRGSVPFSVTVTRPDGACDDWSGHHVLRDGNWTGTLPVVAGLPSGGWRVEAREYASGQRAGGQWE